VNKDTKYAKKINNLMDNLGDPADYLYDLVKECVVLKERIQKILKEIEDN